jgi:hypothetical protein
MLHHVTLGGSGLRGGGARHPQVGHGVLLGAGVTVIGPVKLGAGAKVGAGSVVVTDLEPHSVAVGVPARVIKRAVSEPSLDMDQIGFMLDYGEFGGVWGRFWGGFGGPKTGFCSSSHNISSNLFHTHARTPHAHT